MKMKASLNELKNEIEAIAKEKQIKAKIEEINQQAREIEAKRQAIDEQIIEQLKIERKKIAEQEKAKILAEQSEQTKALEQELEEKESNFLKQIRKNWSLGSSSKNLKKKNLS